MPSSGRVSFSHFVWQLLNPRGRILYGFAIFWCCFCPHRFFFNFKLVGGTAGLALSGTVSFWVSGKSGSALHLFFQSCFAKNVCNEICKETIGTVDFALLRAGLFVASRRAALGSTGPDPIWVCNFLVLFVSTPVFFKFQARRRNGRIGPLWYRLILAPGKSGSALHLFYATKWLSSTFWTSRVCE